MLGAADGATPFRDLVAHDHPSARVGNARQTQDAIGFTADDMVVGVAPFFHPIGQNLILPCSLRVGPRWSPCPASTSSPSWS